MGNSCLTNAHLMLASFTMVFGYSWYLYIDECILSGISVRAVSARFHNLPRHGHIGCSLGGSFPIRVRVGTWTQDV